MASEGCLFNVDVWKPALYKFGAVTHLSVVLYDDQERIVCGPVPPTPLVAVFEKHGYRPDIFRECARKCLAQSENRPAVVVSPYGLAVVGTSLVLEGVTVGSAVAGYAVADFSQTAAIERLARLAGIPFRDLWEITRQQQPIPQRRLILHGELLQVLGDTILRENYRTRQYEDAAARLQKEMAAKDEFLAVVSHELRTPLTPILGWAGILKQSDRKEDRRRASEAIERNALLEMRLVNDLLDMSRLINQKMPLDISSLDLSDLIKNAVGAIADAAAGKQIDVEFAGTSEPLMVEGDTGRLQQVFGNILSNAVKFTPANGRIQVTVEQQANDAIVRIADTGKGIAQHFLPHIFDMFRQQEVGTQRKYSGLGIGLAIVKQLVESHRGQVEVASDGEGCGTQVTVHLPVATREATSSQAVVIEDNQSVPLEHVTILAVEDAEDALETLRRTLEMLGAEVLTAHDGLEGLQLLSIHSADVVVCDLRMPRMDGFEFLRELSRIQGPDHPPVVAISGFTSAADHQRTEAAGFEGHIDKPFDNAALVSTLQSTLDRRRT